MRVRFLKSAREELRDASNYYHRQRKGLGKDLRAEVRAGIKKIRELPMAWPITKEPFRVFQTRRFPYGIIYEVRKSEIVIVAMRIYTDGLVISLAAPRETRANEHA